MHSRRAALPFALIVALAIPRAVFADSPRVRIGEPIAATVDVDRAPVIHALTPGAARVEVALFTGIDAFSAVPMPPAPSRFGGAPYDTAPWSSFSIYGALGIGGAFRVLDRVDLRGRAIFADRALQLLCCGASSNGPRVSRFDSYALLAEGTAWFRLRPDGWTDFALGIQAGALLVAATWSTGGPGAPPAVVSGVVASPFVRVVLALGGAIGNSQVFNWEARVAAGEGWVHPSAPYSSATIDVSLMLSVTLPPARRELRLAPRG